MHRASTLEEAHCQRIRCAKLPYIIRQTLFRMSLFDVHLQRACQGVCGTAQRAVVSQELGHLKVTPSVVVPHGQYFTLNGFICSSISAD